MFASHAGEPRASSTINKKVIFQQIDIKDYTG